MTINTAFFQSIRDQADACDVCADLQRLAAGVLPDLQGVIDAIAEAEAILGAAQELLTLNPATLPALVTFVEKLVGDVLTPMLAPYAKLVAQSAETAAAVASTIASIEAAAARIGDCTIP